MVFLSLQSSNTCVSVSLHDNVNLLGYFATSKIEKKQSESLLQLLEKLFLKFKIKKIDKIYLSRGPGSYTSLRAQLAIAKGIALVFNSKIETITTFDALLQNGSNSHKYFFTIFKENRPEYFFKIFKKDKNRFVEFSKISSGEISVIQTIIEKYKLFFYRDKLEIIADMNYEILRNDCLKEFKKTVRQVNAKDIFKASQKGMSNNIIEPIYLFSHYAKK